MVSDLEQLRSLVDRYATYMDARDGDGLTELWTDDGVLEVFEAGPSLPATGKLRRKNLHVALERLAAFQQTLHHVTTHDAVITGDEATGTTCCIAHHVDRPGGAGARDLVMHIRYRDRYRRVSGAWRFAHRAVEVMFTETGIVEAFS